LDIFNASGSKLGVTGCSSTRRTDCQKQRPGMYFETFFHTGAISAPRFSCRR
jgi:hypothetical protein